jgi:predicted transcriptional regulator
MNKKNEVVREILDAVDETILLALKEGAQSLKDLHALSGINYNTFRQRLDKLARYEFIARPGYGKYALSEKGRRFVEELALPMALDLEDPKLKKLIGILPTELHRAFFRQLLSGIIAKYLLDDVYGDGYPAFILGGETKSFKTALATVVCKVIGLKPEETIYPMFSAIAGELGIRRFRSKGDSFHISASPLFKQSFVCLDEFDKVTDRDTRRNALFFLDGRNKFSTEGVPVENRTCTMVTLNTKIDKVSIKKFGIPEPYIRRSIVTDTEHVRMELRDVDLVAKKIFEMKDFPKINLDKLRLAGTELPNDVFNCLHNLLLGCTEEIFQRLVDTRPLEILTLGRSALLGGDVREAAYQTVWDRLVCLESIGGTVAGWREKVAGEWAKYKQEEQPEIEKQLEEAKRRDKERKLVLTERAAAIEEKKVEQIDDQTAFILHRAELSSQIQRMIQELGRGEPLLDPLKWLRSNIDSSRTPEGLSQYEESFNKSTLPKVKSRLQEKKDAEERAKWEKETAKKIESVVKDIQRKGALERRERQQQQSKRIKDDVLKLRAEIRQINYYLGRKDLKEGEDPVFTLQQLKIIQPVEGWSSLKVSDKPVKGHWQRNRWMGKPEYMPPVRDFIDYGATIQRWSSQVTNGRFYKWSDEVQYWTTWAKVWPLLQAKKEKILEKIARLNLVVPTG